MIINNDMILLVDLVQDTLKILILPETKVERELAFETTILLPPVDLSKEVVADLRTLPVGYCRSEHHSD